MDMSETIKPKTDQLNADDFISGPRNITITGVKGNSDPQQPVSISFQGDNNKPYKPCLSMRRVMVKAWGKDALKYVGRSMTLYCDPNVTFGKIKVGGIRISHMSHIDNDFTIPLTVSKARRAVYPIRVLNVDIPVEETDNSQYDEIIELMDSASKLGVEKFNEYLATLPQDAKRFVFSNPDKESSYYKNALEAAEKTDKEGEV